MRAVDQLLGYVGRNLPLPYPLRARLLKLTKDSRDRKPERFVCAHRSGRFSGDLSSHIDWHVFFNGAYDEAGLNAIEELVADRPSSVAWDVGANVGNHTLLLSRLFERVYAFEPLPSLVGQLRGNIELSGLKNVEIIEIGLADTEGSAPYFCGEHGNQGQGSFARERSSPPDAVLPLQVGDAMFDKLHLEALDFIKIDVEGFEVEVLRGLASTLARARPVVLFEWLADSRRKVSERELIGLFPANYQLFGLVKRRRLRDRLRRAPVLTRTRFDYDQNYSNVVALPQSGVAVE